MRTKTGAAIALLLSACSVGSTESADVIYLNGNVWTGVEGAPRAEAVAVKGERIAFVGSSKEAEKLREKTTEVVDLNGAFVAPGFIDNHVHLIDGGVGLASVDLRDAKTPEEFTRRIGDYAKTLPAGRWVLNGNWDNSLWGGELPAKAWIDAATPETPVFVNRLDGHMALANSAALKAAGVTAKTPAPAGGEIVRDAKGEPTGVLKDGAMDLVIKAIPPLSNAELDQAFDRAQNYALSHGVTEVHDMGAITIGADALAVFRRAHDTGRQKMRVRAYGPLGQWEQRRDFVAEHGKGDDLLMWDRLKGFVDGSLGSTTAWFFEPFTDMPDSSGITVADPDDLKRWVEEADAAGLKLAVHAIGDRANDFQLDLYEEVGGAGIAAKRFRIEHAQHLNAEEIARFGKLKVIASMQPYHAIDDGRWAEKRIGSERIKGTYAFRSLLDAGAILTFGSDWPVAPMDPLAGIDAAMFRRTIDDANPDGWVPEQKITAAEALRAYTVSNAYAAFEDDRLGTIAAGKLADLVVLSADPTQADGSTIRDIEVLRTVVSGEAVFIAED